MFAPLGLRIIPAKHGFIFKDSFRVNTRRSGDSVSYDVLCTILGPGNGREKPKGQAILMFKGTAKGTGD